MKKITRKLNLQAAIINTFFIALVTFCSISMVTAQCTDFDTALWTESQMGGPHDGAVDASGAPGSIALTSANDGTGNAATEYCITIAVSGNISFDWAYASNNGDSFFDPFFFTLNGAATQLSVDGAGALLNQNGSETIAVTAGDVFCFSQQSTDGIFGSATTTISNLAYPCTVNVPTMSEWGLMIFGLLTMNLGLITLRRKEAMFGTL